MPRGDAVQERPTLEQEMASFKGFTTSDGETVDGAVATKEEEAAQVQREAADATAAAAAKAAPVRAVTGQGEEATAEKTPDGDKTQKAPDGDKKPKQTAQERIDDLTRLRRQGERDLTAERRRNDDLERRLAALEGKPLTPPQKGDKTDPDVEPKPADFEYGELDAKYIRALARFEARQEFKVGQTTQQETRQREAAAQEAREFTEKKTALETAGTGKYDDFSEVVIEGAANGDWPMSETLGKLVLGSEVGADIAYHLASNPKEAREVFGKTPLEQAAYFGRLEARFSSTSDAQTETKPAPVKTTKAPPPVKGARGAGDRTQVSPETNDFAAFEALAMRRK